VLGAGPVVGIGVDACSIERMRGLLARQPRFAERVFTEAEQAYAREFVNPAARLAARFAAKEATLKALGAGLGDIALRDVEVVRPDGGDAPAVALHGTAAAWARTRGAACVLVSLTHEQELAVAFAVALGDGSGG
jgi:holo-[acyl-carrier protein] synthase